MTSKILTALLVVLTVSFSSLGHAQENASPPFPAAPPPAVPALENPVTGIFESGRLIVTVSTTRRIKDGPSVNYGYRTGQLMPITVVISVDPGLTVNFDSLDRKVLNKDGSNFELVKPPSVTKIERNGKTIFVLQLLVRSWVIDPAALTFNCQFHYATGLLPDGKSPAWKLGLTPDFVVSTSRTATESSKQLLDGDMSEKKTATSWLAEPLRYGGMLTLLLVPLWLARRLWTIIRLGNSATQAQRAWIVIDRTLHERETAGGRFNEQQLKDIAAVLRDYLNIESIPTSVVQDPLSQFFNAHERKNEMLALCLSALSKLDRAVYGKSELTDEETDALIQEISRIIPRD